MNLTNGVLLNGIYLRNDLNFLSKFFLIQICNARIKLVKTLSIFDDSLNVFTKLVKIMIE